MRLCCVENITRGAVETSYLYIRMGHTTYTHLNDTYLVVGWIGAIGLHRHLSTNYSLRAPNAILSVLPARTRTPAGPLGLTEAAARYP